MEPGELVQYLYEKIPLSRAMQVSTLELNEHCVRLVAPLTPNTNHHATVFGGSASALAILSAWSLLYVRLRFSSPEASIVIQHHRMYYERPMYGEFAARASMAIPEQWPRFLRTLARFGKARVAVNSTIECNGELAARFSGEFVAIDR